MTSSFSTHEFRSALLEYPSVQVPPCPSVGLAVPIYNEAEHIDQLLKDILSQDYQEIREIWLIDGGSDDGTLDVLRTIRDEDDRVRVVQNPKRSTASALNLAFAAMRTDIVMRLDAHAHYSPDVVRQSVMALVRTGAGGVGSIARPLDAKTLVGEAITAAHKSPLGVGVASFRKEGAEGWVDTVWNGCYWRHVVEQVGPLREDLARAEDNDFNERVRREGYGLYLAPNIRAYYRPRQTFGALWSQYFSNGAGVARALAENRRAVGLRHFAPLALVTGLVLPLLGSVVWPPLVFISAAILMAYIAGLLIAAGWAAHTKAGPHLLLLPAALVVLHLSYGLGTLRGLMMDWAWKRMRGRRGAG